MAVVWYSGLALNYWLPGGIIRIIDYPHPWTTPPSDLQHPLQRQMQRSHLFSVGAGVTEERPKLKSVFHRNNLESNWPKHAGSLDFSALRLQCSSAHRRTMIIGTNEQQHCWLEICREKKQNSTLTQSQTYELWTWFEPNILGRQWEVIK